MTIRAKAVSTLLVLVLLTIVAGAVVLFTHRQATTLTNEAFRRSAVRQLHSDLALLLHEIRSDRRIYLLTGAATLPDRIKTNQERAREALAALDGNVRDPGQRQLLALLTTQVTSWERPSFLNPFPSPSQQQVEQVLRASDRLFEPIDSRLMEFERRQRELAEGALQQSAEYRRVAQISIAGVSLGLAVVIGALLVILNRSVLNPLATLTEAAGRIAYGNVTTIAPVQRSDEVGLLTNALSKMVSTVTEREIEARRTHRELLATLETVPAAFLLVDPAGTVRLQNRAAVALLGAAPAQGSALEHFRREFRLFMRDGREIPGDQWPLARALRGETVAGDEIELHGHGTTVPVVAAAAPVREASGDIVGAVGAFQDVSALRAVDRMKDEFVSIVSHELRTPLTSIRGSLQLVLSDGTVIDAEHQQLLKVALNNCERLIRIINDILDISKMEAGRLTLQTRAVNVPDLISLSLESVAEIARAGEVAFDVRIGDDIPAVIVDQDRMVQAFVNLLSNAVKFAPPSSRVHVDARKLGSEVEIGFEDHGGGIAPEHVGTLFQKFHQVDQSASRRKGGTGLGLAITKAIIEQHGGRIAVTSRVGEGTRFSVILPAADVMVPRSVPRPLEPAVKMPGRTVLIIDDDDEFRLVIRKHLERVGYAVLEAREGAAGLHVARETRPDLITLDLMMPGMNGWDLLARLTEDPELSAIPVIVISAVADHAGPLAREVAVMAKPIGQEELLRQISGAVGAAGATVLVAEDDDELRAVLAAALTRRGYRVITARDGAEALARIDDEKIDLVVLDLKMPNVDGLAVIRRLRETATTGNVPIVVVSGSDGEGRSEFRAMRLGANAYLPKPIDAAELAQHIQHLLARPG